MQVNKLSANAKDCPYCEKTVPSQGLKNHVRWCRQNPDSKHAPSDSDEGACAPEKQVIKGGMQTINLQQTFAVPPASDESDKRPKRRGRCFFFFTHSSFCAYFSNSLVWLVLAIVVLGLLPNVLPLAQLVVLKVQNGITLCRLFNGTLYRLVTLLFEEEEARILGEQPGLDPDSQHADRVQSNKDGPKKDAAKEAAPKEAAPKKDAAKKVVNKADAKGQTKLKVKESKPAPKVEAAPEGDARGTDQVAAPAQAQWAPRPRPAGVVAQQTHSQHVSLVLSDENLLCFQNAQLYLA